MPLVLTPSLLSVLPPAMKSLSVAPGQPATHNHPLVSPARMTRQNPSVLQRQGQDWSCNAEEIITLGRAAGSDVA